MKKTRMLGMLLFGSVVIITVWRMWDMNSERSLDMEVIAHRGDSVNAPENTLAAVELAVGAGADFIEVDLRMTKDGVPVILHDETLTRVTGTERPICELNYWEARKMDAGKWFSPDFSGERIPSLKELLKAAKGRIKLMIELKEVSNKEELLERTIAEIQTMDMEMECILASGSFDILRKGEELEPELKKFYIGEKIEVNMWDLPYVDGYSIYSKAVSKGDVEKAHMLGYKLYVWTVNDLWNVRKAVKMGVDGVVTDDPQLVLKILNAG